MPQVNEVSWQYTSFGIFLTFVLISLAMNYSLFKEELMCNSFYTIFYASIL